MAQNVSKKMACKIGSLENESETSNIDKEINEKNCCQKTDDLVVQQADNSAYAQLMHPEHTYYEIVRVSDQSNEDEDYLQAIDQGNKDIYNSLPMSLKMCFALILL